MSAAMCGVRRTALTSLPVLAKVAALPALQAHSVHLTGEGRITGCVREHFTKLSAPCKNALISGATITKACKANYQLIPASGDSQMW